MLISRIVAVAAGVALVVWVLDAAIRTFMLPRASKVRLSRWLGLLVGRGIELIAPRRRSSYEWQDRVQSFRSPLTVLAFQATWLFFVFCGFTAIFWGVTGVAVTEAARESGSALFTLGFASPASDGALFLVYIEALIGLTLLALLISYLPTLHAAVQRRELMVAKLGIRAGVPASPWHALVVAHHNNSLSYMDTRMWSDWEDWFIELAESHTSLALLNFYRSPDPRTHWVSAARAVLDTAALRLSVIDVPPTIDSRVAIRSGYIAMRRLADYFQIDYSPEPRPDDPISISREQFDAACAYIATSGLPLVPDLDQAWIDFAGWRVNYDAVIEMLAFLLIAPPNPWDSVTTAVSPYTRGIF
jgi:hypothetical protein